MSEKISAMLAQMHKLEKDLRDELEFARNPAQRADKKGNINREMLNEQRALRTELFTYVVKAQISSLLTAPLIYSMVLPILLLDIWATLYQHVCFRAFGIGRVRRSDFVVIDRQHLPYLNLLEKLNCFYCGYGNGVIAYVREIASKTEQYWCPIKHGRMPMTPHHRYHGFADYGDAAAYRERLNDLRKELQQEGKLRESKNWEK